LLYSDQGQGSTPAGWDQVSGSPWGSSTPKLQAFYRFLQAGDSNPVTTISGSGTNISHCAAIATFNGVNSTTPIEVVGAASAGTGTPMTAASIDTLTNLAWALGLCGRGDNESASGQSFGGSTTGVTERFDSGTSAGADSQVSLYSKEISPAGATGQGSAVTSATDPWVSVIIALKPGGAIYDETGKVQVVVAAQGKYDNQAMVETATQDILATQGATDLVERAETGLTQVVMAAQGEQDGFLFSETGRLEEIVAAQGKTDELVMAEARAEIIITEMGKGESMEMSETARQQVALATQGGQDIMTLPELGREQVIVATQGQSDTVVAEEGALEETIIIAQGQSDSYIMGETEKEQVLLAVTGGSDEYIPAGGGGKKFYAGGFANYNRFERRGWR
jgi:hypothetical protein